jgi:hypothetical protein
MAISFGSSDAFSPQPAPTETATTAPAGPWDELLERLRGTVTILGDVVNADPELWTCEREG